MEIGQRKKFKPQMPDLGPKSPRTYICLGDCRQNYYETTNKTSYQPIEINDNQRASGDYYRSTHWTTGNYSGDMESEMKSGFQEPIKSSNEVPTFPIKNLHITTFKLGDDSIAFPSSNALPVHAPSDLIPSINYKNIHRSHIKITDGVEDNWTTVSKSAFLPQKIEPNEKSNTNLQDSKSVASTITSDAYRHTEPSLYSDSFKPHETPPLDFSVMKKMKSTNVCLGDLETDYSPTKEYFTSDGSRPLDEIALQNKANFEIVKSSPSSKTIKDSFESTTRSTYVKPKITVPQLLDISRLRDSHVRFGNDNIPFVSTTRSSYPAYDLKDMELPVCKNKSESHIKINAPEFNEFTTTARSSFNKHNIVQHYDTTALRENMNSHHSKGMDFIFPPLSTYRSDYVKPKNYDKTTATSIPESTLFPKDERFNPKTSIEHEKYRPPPLSARVPPYKQSFLESSIRFEKDMVFDTTSCEYFQFESFSKTGLN